MPVHAINREKVIDVPDQLIKSLDRVSGAKRCSRAALIREELRRNCGDIETLPRLPGADKLAGRIFQPFEINGLRRNQRLFPHNTGRGSAAHWGKVNGRHRPEQTGCEAGGFLLDAPA